MSVSRQVSLRVGILVLFVFLCLVESEVQAQRQPLNFRKLSNVTIPMSDGVNLSTDIYLPKEAGQYPVLLSRTPYGKGGDYNDGHANYFVNHGYAVVIQDCRGKGRSQGDWEPFVNEAKDGFETQQWLLKQPWCNGKLGTFGGSYVGFTQWASAPKAGDYLKCLVPVVPLIEPYYDGGFYDGALRLALGFGWGAEVSYRPGEKRAMDGWNYSDWNKAYGTLPLKEWDKGIGKEVPYLREWIRHYRYDDYWKQRGVLPQISQIKSPVLLMGGWYDIFAETALRHIDTLRQSTQSPPAIHTIMGPWVHNMNQNGRVGEIEFGRASATDLLKFHLQWYDHWLKDQKNVVEDWPAYRLFVMGRNRWREEQQWPPAGVSYTNYYLHSNGSANTLSGDGALSTQMPENEPVDRYVYDPENPVITLGGSNLVGCPDGPRNQISAEQREDVLVYSSEPLETELEAIGPIKVILYAASDALDTDWTAKLVDVYPDGRAFNLCDGIIRARFRDLSEQELLLTPGQVEKYTIDLGVTSNAFLKGHRIRLEISSSNFPRFDRNPNTGHPFGQDTQLKKAKQQVYHGRVYASHIILPVIAN